MSWSAHNLYNLIARSTVPFNIAGTDFSRTALTMYQQRWRAKRFIRGYHGDWIPERRFKRWFLPIDLPKLVPSSTAIGASTISATHLPSRAAASSSRRGGAEADDGSEQSQMPTASLFMSEVERRLDVIVFRCCFARSVYEARNMVIHGKVKLNGRKASDPNRLLTPGDLITVTPSAIPMLSKVVKKRAARRAKAKRKASGAPAKEVKDGEEGAAKGSEQAAAEAEPKAEEVAEASAEKVEEELKALSDEASASAPASAAEGASEVSAETAAPSEATPAAEEDVKDKGKGKAKAESSSKDKSSTKSEAAKQQQQLPCGVLPFNLPPFAAPFLFIPSYLETSFTTCSAIYLRHPTIVPSGAGPSRPSAYNRGGTVPEYLSEIPSPYPASGDIFSMAWEHYARTAPRIRGDMRRLQLKAKVGLGEDGGGMERERAKVVWKRMRAVRRGWTRTMTGKGSSATAVPPTAGSTSRLASASKAQPSSS